MTDSHLTAWIVFLLMISGIVFTVLHTSVRWLEKLRYRKKRRDDLIANRLGGGWVLPHPTTLDEYRFFTERAPPRAWSLREQIRREVRSPLVLAWWVQGLLLVTAESAWESSTSRPWARWRWGTTRWLFAPPCSFAGEAPSEGWSCRP